MGTAGYGGKGQGKGKGRGEGQLGQGGRGRSQGGEKPMGTTADGGKGSKGRAANGDRPVGAAKLQTRSSHQRRHAKTPPLQRTAMRPVRDAAGSPGAASAACPVPLSPPRADEDPSMDSPHSRAKMFSEDETPDIRAIYNTLNQCTPYLRDPFYILDGVIVICSIVSILPGLQDWHWLRGIRALRPLRIMGRMKGMRIVFLALLQSFSSLAYIFVLAIILVLTFAILAIQYYKEKFGCAVFRTGGGGGGQLGPGEFGPPKSPHIVPHVPT